MVDNNSSQLHLLTRINTEDMLANFGLQDSRIGRIVISALFHRAAQGFARQMVEFDRRVGAFGLQEGSRPTLSLFSEGLRVQGQEHIPPSGPLLVLSNHPGIADTLALFTSLPRPDLRVVAVERPFLKALEAVSRYLIYLPEQDEGRLQVMRNIAATLRSGGAILNFPAGKIEPDPAVLPGAAEALNKWSQSTAVFVRMAPQLNIVGAVVSHVLAPQATYHPLTRLRRRQIDRERLGATIQIAAHTLFPKMWPVTTQVTYTPPLPAARLLELREAGAITRAVTEYIRPYIAAAARD